MTGNDLAALRARLDRTQQQMSALFGVSPRNYQSKENLGERELPQVWTLAVIGLQVALAEELSKGEE